MPDAAPSWDAGGFRGPGRDGRTSRDRSRSVEARVAKLLVRKERDWVAPLTRSRPTTAVEDLVGRLRDLERFQAGWDGRSGAAADPLSFDDARSFVYLLGPRDPLPEEGIHANGRAVLTFEGSDLFATLHFCGRGVIGAYVCRGDEEWDDDIRFDGVTLPQELRSKLGLRGLI